MLTRVSNQKGSNEGGFYRDNKNGSKFYVKFYADVNQAYSEALANRIYRELGINAPLSMVGQVDGRTALISTVVNGSPLGYDYTSETARQICKGFLADAFMANYDVIGLINDNILVDGDTVTRIDNGSAFLYRARGSKKDFNELLNGIGELESFFNRGQYPAVLKKAGIQTRVDFALNLTEVQNKLIELGSNGWDNFVSKMFPLWNTTEKTQTVAMLDARTRCLEINKISIDKVASVC